MNKVKLSLGAVALVVWLMAGAKTLEPFRPQPLGEPGNLTYPTELKMKPVFKAAPVRKPGFVLVDGERVVTVVTPSHSERRDLWNLGEEFAYHLEKMSGRKIVHVEGYDKRPKNGPVVVIGDDDGEVKPETMIVRATGDELYLGGQGAGISHALTYVLEALGCRYLWPGKTGKVIPKAEKVVLSEMTVSEAPMLRERNLMIVNPEASSMRKTFLPFVGIDAKAYAQVVVEKGCDHRNNRGFWQWHGVCDAYLIRSKTPSFAKQLDTGHYFNDYYRKYGKDHPDWFSQQQNGSREQFSSHPRLCLSNPELIEEVARDRIAFFRAHPEKYTATVSMPDGSYDSYCFCENCRRLDPPNAPKMTDTLYDAQMNRTPLEYVFLTDRVTTFWNAVAERVTKVFPDRKLLVLSYSTHDRPPVRVKPHPALLYQNVSGDYNKTANREWGSRSLAAWLSFGNETIWRPNCLNGFRSCLPLDFSDKIFGDVELAKANGVIGVKLDEGDRSHALKALTFYMVAKALFNPDRLDYATIVDDFCTRGFGRAAPAIREYYAELRKTFDAAADLGKGPEGYVDLFDVEKFAAILDRAALLAREDDEVVRRIDFLKIGIFFARETRRLRNAWMTGSMKILTPARDQFKGIVRAYAFYEPYAVDAQSAAWRHGTYLRGGAKNVPLEQMRAVEKQAQETRPGQGYPDENGHWVLLEN